MQNIYILAGVLLVILAVAIVAVARFLFDLRKKVLLLFGGKATEKEGEFLREAARRLARAEAKLEEFGPRIDLLEKISKISVQKVGFLRFNPFQDTGGDQSFILALLDRENNGVLLSSLYAREGMRVYAKNVTGGRSKHLLSEEEKGVLNEALNSKI